MLARSFDPISGMVIYQPEETGILQCVRTLTVSLKRKNHSAVLMLLAMQHAPLWSQRDSKGRNKRPIA